MIQENKEQECKKCGRVFGSVRCFDVDCPNNTPKITVNQEHKELLLKDLCARLPYKVKVKTKDGKHPLPFTAFHLDFYKYNIEDIKPYLFPMSSMTDEQYDEMYNYCYNAEREASKFSNGGLKIIYTFEMFKFDWLNKNHFDWRGLIPMGLAEDATGLNIY